MKSPKEQLRCIVDRLNKQAATRPDLPTGKDNRTIEEAMHTGADARNIARMASKKQNVMRTIPLSELQKRAGGQRK